MCNGSTTVSKTVSPSSNLGGHAKRSVGTAKDEHKKWQVALASRFRKPLNNAQTFISAIQLGKTAILLKKIKTAATA